MLYQPVNIFMKNILFFFMFLCFSFPSFSQINLTQEKAKVITERIEQIYQLNKLQKAKVLKIQQQKFKNLAEIHALQKTDSNLFLKKKQQIAKSTQASIKKLLNQHQLQIFEKELQNLEKKKSKKIAELKEQGATKEVILHTIIDLDFI